MLRLFTMLCAGLLCLGIASADDKDAKDDKQSPLELEGTYTLVSGEKDGQPIPAERIQGSVVMIKGDRVTGTDKDKKEFFAVTFKLDTSARPCKIHMTSVSPQEGMKAEGIVEAQGDTVKICYALPGGTTPQEFKTQAKQHCFILKRTGK